MVVFGNIFIGTGWSRRPGLFAIRPWAKYGLSRPFTVELGTFGRHFEKKHAQDAQAKCDAFFCLSNATVDHK